MIWNHRIIRNGDTLFFAEVSYDESGNPYAWNEPFLCSDDLEGMKVVAARLRDACDKPILDSADLENYSKLEVA